MDEPATVRPASEPLLRPNSTSHRRLAPRAYPLKPSSHELMAQAARAVISSSKAHESGRQRSISSSSSSSSSTSSTLSSSQRAPPRSQSTMVISRSRTSALTRRAIGHELIRHEHGPADSETLISYQRSPNSAPQITNNFIDGSNLTIPGHVRELHLHNHVYHRDGHFPALHSPSSSPPRSSQAPPPTLQGQLDRPSPWSQLLAFLVPLTLLISNLVWWLLLPLLAQLRDEIVSKALLGYSVAWSWRVVWWWVHGQAEPVVDGCRWYFEVATSSLLRWVGLRAGGVEDARLRQGMPGEVDGGRDVVAAAPTLIATWTARALGCAHPTQAALTVLLIGAGVVYLFRARGKKETSRNSGTI